MITIYKKIWFLFDADERKKAVILLLLMLLVGFFEIIGIGSVMPFLAVLGDASIINTNEYLSYIYNMFEFNSKENFLIFLGISAIGLLLVSAFLKTLTYYGLFRFSNMRRHNIGRKLLLQYIHKPYKFFLIKNSSYISKTILSETDLAIGQVIIPSLQLITSLIISIFIIGFLIYVNPFLAFVLAVIFGGFYLVMYMTVRKYLSRIGDEREKANSIRFKLISEIIGGIKDLKLLGRENIYVKGYESPSYAFSSHTATSQILTTAPQFIVEVIAFGAILIMAMYALSNDSANLGKLLPILGLYTFGALKLKPAINQIYSSITTMKFGASAIDTITKEFEGDIVDKSLLNKGHRLPLLDKIELNSINFKYDNVETKALENINLSIKANSSVGIIGTTGAGKSTLLDIILGLIEPIEGKIKIDSKELTVSTLREWQNSIGYVSQSIFLIDDTIANNIAFGIDKNLINYDQVEKVLRMAQIDEFINSLELGYNTQVGERGVRLSGGQRQRLGIARALYHDPSLIVLDEATSALDTETEKEVMKSINSMSGEKTIIMIAHRLSTVENCDLIVSMEKGKIINVQRKELDI